MRSRLNEYLSTTELSRLLMRNRTFQYRYFSQILLCSFNTFGNSGSYFAGFTKAPTDDTFFISYYHNSRETKSSTTFGYFGYTINSNQSVFQFYIVCNLNSIIKSCHND